MVELTNNLPTNDLPTLTEKVELAIADDLLLGEVRKVLTEGGDISTGAKTKLREMKVSLGDCKLIDDRVWHRNRLWIPNDPELVLAVLQAFHDAPLRGHCGKARTFSAVNQLYFWPGMLDDVRRYVRNCHTCKRAKAFRSSYSGGLQQLTVPERPWTEIAVDFVVDLPLSVSPTDGIEYSNVMVVTDRLTKWRYYIPCVSMDARSVARLFLRFIFSRYRLSDFMVSN